jgi:hypothetical protein
MIMNRQHIIPLLLVQIFILTACFEEDKKVPPHVPGDEISYEFENSMYTTQAFFDLGTNKVMTENINEVWTIKFGALSGDWHIGINSAGLWAVYPSGTPIEDSIPARISTDEWIFDHSGGDPDSSAFAGWVSFEEDDTLYSEHIYLIGKYNFAFYQPRYAAQFLKLDKSTYRFRIKSWPSGEWEEHEILKDDLYNYIYFSADDRSIIPGIEPGKNSWDLLFTQYGSILFTDDGEPTPYYVRGVLLNRHNLSVAIDSVKAFQEIAFEDLSTYQFTQQQDVIGYEWKDVDVDEISGTAVYTVLPGITYIIRDTEGLFYKMRFISYYNDMGEKGFPLIEHASL